MVEYVVVLNGKRHSEGVWPSVLIEQSQRISALLSLSSFFSQGREVLCRPRRSWSLLRNLHVANTPNNCKCSQRIVNAVSSSSTKQLQGKSLSRAPEADKTASLLEGLNDPQEDLQ